VVLKSSHFCEKLLLPAVADAEAEALVEEEEVAEAEEESVVVAEVETVEPSLSVVRETSMEAEREASVPVPVTAKESEVSSRLRGGRGKTRRTVKSRRGVGRNRRLVVPARNAELAVFVDACRIEKVSPHKEAASERKRTRRRKCKTSPSLAWQAQS
jgi:hypothetical protein